MVLEAERSYIDLGEIQGGVWETASFTVPKGTSHERVMFKKDVYMARFGESLEQQGFEVLHMGDPEPVSRQAPWIDEDRKKYRIKAWVRRRPVTSTFDVPDAAVPDMQAVGMKLID